MDNGAEKEFMLDDRQKIGNRLIPVIPKKPIFWTDICYSHEHGQCYTDGDCTLQSAGLANTCVRYKRYKRNNAKLLARGDK